MIGKDNNSFINIFDIITLSEGPKNALIKAIQRLITSPIFLYLKYPHLTNGKISARFWAANNIFACNQVKLILLISKNQNVVQSGET